MKRPLPAVVPHLLLALAVAGCSSLETSITLPEDRPTSLALNLEVPESSISNAVSPSLSVRQTTGDTVLNITEALIVVREMQFRRDTTDGVDACVEAEDASTDDGDACEEAWVAPEFLGTPEVPVDVGSEILGTLVVEPGTYDGLEFDVHETQAGDGNIVNRRPQMVGFSVEVRGTFSVGGTGNTLDSAKFTPTGTVALPLENPIDLEQGFSSTMTLTVDVASWFEDEGVLLNPDAAAQDTALARQVSERILSSFSLRAGT